MTTYRAVGPGRSRAILIYLAKIMLLAVAYHGAARVGLLMASIQINTSPVWPPTGIALAALLLYGTNLWPGVTLGVLLGSLLGGAPFSLALGFALGNTSEALIAAVSLRRLFAFHSAIDRVQDAVALAGVSVVATAVSATAGAGTLLLTGRTGPEGFATIWTTWWVGNLLGALVVAPALLVWATPAPSKSPRSRIAEAGALLLLLGLVTGYVFSDRPPISIFHQAMLYMIFPFLIWAALRLGQRGSAASVILVSGIAIWGTATGTGPFALESVNDSLVLLQTFTGVVAVAALVLASAIAERGRTAGALRQRADELATLNESSRAFLDSIDLPDIYHAICQVAVERLGLDATWIETDGLGDTPNQLPAAHGIPFDAIPNVRSYWEADSLHLEGPGTIIRTVDDLPKPSPRPDLPHGAYASIPLVLGGEPFGVLKLLSTDKLFFTQDRVLLIQSYANVAAVVIQNSWLLEEVRSSNRQLRGLSQRLMQAQERERLHLSRELHDESGQLLAGLMVQLGLLERGIDAEEELHPRVAELKKTTREIQENLHSLAVNLRPASLDHLGLVTALGQYVSEFGDQYSIQVGFETVGLNEDRLPDDVETALFRVVQESLTNVALHAKARQVDVLLIRRGSRIVATIEDDGVGFLVTPSNLEDHLGLFGIRERVEMLGGRFTLESSPGKGTTVSVEVPIHA